MGGIKLVVLGLSSQVEAKLAVVPVLFFLQFDKAVQWASHIKQFYECFLFLFYSENWPMVLGSFVSSHFDIPVVIGFAIFCNWGYVSRPIKPCYFLSLGRSF